MDLTKLKRKDFKDFLAYVPGWQPPDGEQWVKLNTNETPYGPPQPVLDEIKVHVDATLRLYPEPAPRELRELFAKVILAPIDPTLAPENVMWGLGCDEILDLLMRAFIDPGDRVVYFQPSYGMYDVLARVYAAERVVLELDEKFAIPASTQIPPGKMLILCSPNNPNGQSYSNETISRLCQSFPGLVVVDEAYADFAPVTSLALLAKCPNLVVTRTFSKCFALAGERIGVMVATKEIVDAINTVRLPFNMTRLNMAAARASLRYYDAARETIKKIVGERARLTRALPAVDKRLEVLPSDANFLLVRCPSSDFANGVVDHLKGQKILVRYFDKPGLRTYFRVTIGTPEENNAFLAGLAKSISSRAK